MPLSYGQSINETDVILYFAGDIGPDLIAFIQQAKKALAQAFGGDLIDSVASYQSLLLCFSPLCQTAPIKRLQKAQDIIKALPPASQSQNIKTLELPVYYGPEAGADFNAVCQKLNLTSDELIQKHSGKTYDVYALGFSPGFAFMGLLDDNLHLPRLDEPRKSIPKGSLAIAKNQTTVYPSVSPGGWLLIGRCPLALFDANKTPASLLAVGNKVRFVPISRAQFFKLGGELWA